MNDMTAIARGSWIAAQALERLDAMRLAIARELATIPPPVPACDVDFNRLLDDRARIADEMQQLRQLIAQKADDAEIAAFCRNSAFIDESTLGRNPGSKGEA